MSPENTSIIELIEKDRAHLLQTWIDAVRSDPRILSDADLSEGGLIDHVPSVIEELCAILRRGEMPSPVNSREARVHAYTRFRQNYRIRDLVRETSLLRLIMLDHIGKFMLDASPPVSLKIFIEATHIINLYIDEELRYAVAIYTEESEK